MAKKELFFKKENYFWLIMNKSNSNLYYKINRRNNYILGLKYNFPFLEMTSLRVSKQIFLLFKDKIISYKSSH